jgi:Uma2 family endonuclease
MTTKAHATIEDLYALPDNQKAEIVDRELVLISPTGDAPGYAADEAFVSLREHSRSTGSGRAFADNKGFIVNLPNRDSFSPDAAYYTGPRSGGDFLQGAPVSAVEVRSKGDYGPKSELAMKEKRADYFAAGTQVVWDVDVLKEQVIRVYRYTNPDIPTVYRRGEISEAEPAVPGWTMPLDDLFCR